MTGEGWRTQWLLAGSSGRLSVLLLPPLPLLQEHIILTFPTTQARILEWVAISFEPPSPVSSALQADPSPAEP